MKKRWTSRFNHRAWAIAAVTAAFLVPLLVIGAPALAKTAAAVSQYGHKHSGSAQYEYKITICHREHSKRHPFHEIRVDQHAAKAHLRHGDTLGNCPATVPVPMPVPPHQRGDDGDHGNGNGHQGDDQGDDNGSSGDHGHGNGGGGGGDGHGHGHGK